MNLEFVRSESAAVAKQKQKAQRLFKKYAKVIDWVEYQGVDWDCMSKEEKVGYFVALKKPYGIDDGDYYADHFAGWVEELEGDFKCVEKIDPAVWDNNGEPIK